MRMATPHNHLLLERCVGNSCKTTYECSKVHVNSIDSLSIPDLIKMAHHQTSSRVLDAIFESSTIPQRARNKFVLKFIGHFRELVDDRIGSRVGDRMWAGSDPYLKASDAAGQRWMLIMTPP